MSLRHLLAVALVLALSGVPAAALPASEPPLGDERVTAPLGDNPWLERRVLNIGHRGGVIEVPENTLFGFHDALERGVDVLEMDMYATADGEVVLIHDTTVDRTTDGSGPVEDFTLEELKALDAAHWFVPGRGTPRDAAADDYVYRGVATGEVEPPEGFEPNDFTIPTLREVLETFPDTMLVIEFKTGMPDGTAFHEEVAELLEEFDRTDDVIVASFVDTYLEPFKLIAPDVHTSTATGQAAVFWASAQGPAPGAPNPRYQALQVPITFEGLEVVNEDFVARAQANGFAVHVWTINDRETMEWLLDIGVDGIMTDRPSLLDELLAERGIGYAP